MPRRTNNPAQAIEIKRLFDVYNFMLKNKNNTSIGWDEVIKIFKSISMKNMPGKIRDVYDEMLEFLETLRAKSEEKVEPCILDREMRSASTSPKI